MYEIIDYSEKAIALVGDTKGIKDQLKGLGGRFNPRLTCGAGWIFPKSKRDAVESIIKGEPTAPLTPAKPLRKPKGIAPDIKADIVSYYTKVWGKDEKMIDFCVKEIGHAARLSNGLILTIDKPSIETSFCFGESGHDYKEAADMAYRVAKTEEYFRNENLADFDRFIDRLKKTREVNKWGGHEEWAYIAHTSYYSCDDRALCTLFISRQTPDGLVLGGRRTQGSFEPLPDEDFETVLALYEEARAAFAKRIDAYLKRYGTSKVKSWTYWRDA